MALVKGLYPDFVDVAIPQRLQRRAVFQCSERHQETITRSLLTAVYKVRCETKAY